jgi:tetratricopeptide (TPR) repeat protein
MKAAHTSSVVGVFHYFRSMALLRKIWILLLLVLSFCNVRSQTLEQAFQLYQKHNNPEALEMYEQLTKVDSTAAAANFMIGKIYAEVKNFSGAVQKLQKAIEIDRDGTVVSGWSHAYLGQIYYQTGDFRKVAWELNKAIELNMNEVSVDFAQSQLMGLMADEAKFDSAAALARILMNKHMENPEPYMVLGTIHLYTHRPDSAVFYLHAAIKLNDDKSWVSAWAHVHLGETYLSVGDIEDAAYELNNAVRLNKAPSSVKFAQRLLDSMNYLSPVESPKLKNLAAPKWIVIEGASITYYFQDTAGRGAKIQRYIAEHELAYLKINEVFQSVIPKKMKLYVWDNRELAKRILNRELGSTNARVCTSNVAFDETVGHEMTHTFSFWSFGAPNTFSSRFINEGLAVAFDQDEHNKVEAAKKAMAGKKFTGVLDFWKTEDMDEKVLNPVAGAFVDFLYRKSTPEQFKSVVKDQSQANAERTFGAEQFQQLVKQFDKQMRTK